MNHDLLDSMLRSARKLSPIELEVLLAVAQKQLKEKPTTADDQLLVKDDVAGDGPQDPDLLVRKI